MKWANCNVAERQELLRQAVLLLESTIPDDEHNSQVKHDIKKALDDN